MRPLSNRLQAIFDLVPTSAKVCDVGTDHAYLPIALSKSQKAKTIIACDVNESPLKKAQENLDKAKVKNVDLRLSDGLSKVSENEADTVIIAGMGGLLMCSILERGINTMNGGCQEEKKMKTPADNLCRPILILQPQSDICEVRK